MYSIKMNSDKSLTTTIKATIYQGEKNADTLVFLVPMQYEEKDIADCTMLLRFILPSGYGKSEELEMDPEPYKEYYMYRLKATSSFTETSGDMELWLSAVDISDNLILKTGSVFVTVYPQKNITDYFSPEDSDQLTQLTLKVAQLENEKADSIIYNTEDNYLQLTANGTPIGDQLSMEEVVEDAGGEIIDFGGNDDSSSDESGNTSDEESTEDSDTVIHF